MLGKATSISPREIMIRALSKTSGMRMYRIADMAWYNDNMNATGSSSVSLAGCNSS